MPSKQEIEDIINAVIVRTGDIVFQHALFLQCFLPLRSLPKNEYIYQFNHGKASLVIQAGLLIKPNDMQQVEKREVPAGAKARLLFAYINDQAIKTGSPVINMSQSLREFMERNGVPIGGRNAKEITRQVKNIAAAEILIGVWGEHQAVQDQVKIAKRLSFWIDKDPRQATLWQPEMTLSSDYLEALKHHRVPLDFRALVGLQANPRAMDIYCWLAYRLHTVKAPIKIPYEALHPIFGRGIKYLRDFKIHFKRSLIEARRFYPDARIESQKDYITLYHSPAPIPLRGQVQSGKGMLAKR